MYEVDREAEIIKYLPLVERVVQRLSIKTADYESGDLYNIGVIGLMDALRKFVLEPGKVINWNGKSVKLPPLKMCIFAGTNPFPILVGGSAGEFYALDYNEAEQLISDAVQYINHRGIVPH